MLRFVRQARGSSYELIDHVDMAAACGYLSHSVAEGRTYRVSGVIRLLNGYARYLRRCLTGDTKGIGVTG